MSNGGQFRLPASYYDPPDMPDIRELRHATHVAGKEHDCSWCKRKIPLGEKYYIYVYIEDGEFRYDRIHRSCYHGDDYRHVKE